MAKLTLLISIVFSFAFITAANAQYSSIFSQGSSTIKNTNNEVRYQRGYYRSDGTYVQGHYKTQSNQTNWDNYSTSQNTNSFTGEEGHRARDYSDNAYHYGSGHTIYTGPRGGQYYINSRGNKVYVPKRQ